jgi:hypothetical protein
VPVLSAVLVSAQCGGAQYHFSISQIGGRNYLGFELEHVLFRTETAREAICSVTKIRTADDSVITRRSPC